MKYVLLATVLVLALSTSSEESVLQLLGELKHNAELELEGLELAWQRRIAEKQSVSDSLNQSVINQRAECQNKQDDITQKQNDILASESFINWMLGRQKSNVKRIGVLEANICALTNNYVNDIRNYRYALAVVKFLREELVQLEQGASLAQITQFHERITKFVKLYKTGTLVNLIEKIDDGVIVPEIEQGTFDEVSLIQRLRPKALSQLDQQEDDDKTDNAVVLIPGCDDSINTVVVVQNDDGSSNSGDVNVKITNGGATTKPVGGKSTGGSSGSTKKPQPATDPVHHHEVVPEDDDEESTGDDDTEEAEDDTEDDTEDDAEDQGEDSGEGETDDGEDGEESGDGEDTHTNGEDNGEESGEDDGEEHEQITIDDFHQPHEQPHEDPKPIIIGPHVEGEEDFTDDWEGFKKLLDAIEKHTKKSLEQSANDEVRSSLGFVDFKLHVELENQHFDKTIQYEQDYLVKQVNQLTGRRQAAILCGARLKQLQVASQVAQKDIDAAKQFYLEQKQLKQEEVNTFDDVFRIYTTQVKN